MARLAPYDVLIGAGAAHGPLTQVVETILHDLIRDVLARVEVDEAWYRRAYPDVDQAIAEAKVRSAREHYLLTGYFEGRLPRPVKVDQAWYIETNPDVAEAISDGRVASPQQHFETAGFREGRIPHEGWEL